MQIPKIRVRIGEWDFSTTGESHAHVERKVTRKVVHPKYNFFTYENDLALVRLEKKAPFQPNIVPICLPGHADSFLAAEGRPRSPLAHRPAPRCAHHCLPMPSLRSTSPAGRFFTHCARKVFDMGSS